MFVRLVLLLERARTMYRGLVIRHAGKLFHVVASILRMRRNKNRSAVGRVFPVVSGCVVSVQYCKPRYGRR